MKHIHSWVIESVRIIAVNPFFEIVYVSEWKGSLNLYKVKQSETLRV